MAFLKVPDGNLYYEVHGEGEPLFLISGFGADHLLWQAVLDVFAHRYKVILLDNRGVGRTENTAETLSINLFAQDVLALADHLSVERFYVIGSSMGGMITQELMMMVPERIIASVLSNSMMYRDIKLGLFSEGMAEVMSAPVPPLALIKMFVVWAYSSKFLSKEKNKKVLFELMLNNPYPITPENYKKQLKALNAFNSEAWLGDIQVPTLVLGSKIDLIVAEAHSHKMAELLPNSECYIFEDEAHVPFIENPKLFLEVVQGFLTNQQ